MMLGVILVPKTPEHDQFLDPKFIGQDLYGEMACAKFRDFSSRSCGPFNIGPSYSNADTSVILG